MQSFVVASIVFLALVGMFALGVAYSNDVKKRKQEAVDAVEAKAAPVFKAFGDVAKVTKSVGEIL